MKRHLCLSMLAAALAGAPAHAGSDIVKCVDSAGHITLTDQPCDSGATMVRVVTSAVDQAGTRAEPHPLAVEHGALPPRALPRRPAAPRVKAKPLMRDVATLKAAHAQFLLMDAGARQTTLATLD
ncbi:DUF4124 domain-containing protein [Massilia sp. UMI-21]|nr:DUF4124 domain-containing protein [Massilia sp. UMI-21]